MLVGGRFFNLSVDNFIQRIIVWTFASDKMMSHEKIVGYCICGNDYDSRCFMRDTGQ